MNRDPMPDPVLVAFAGGAAAMGFVVAGLFFLRFYVRTRDGLFLAFAMAFWLMGANSAIPTLVGHPSDPRGEIYLLRLAAFLLIIGAILAKNLKARR